MENNVNNINTLDPFIPYLTKNGDNFDIDNITRLDTSHISSHVNNISNPVNNISSPINDVEKSINDAISVQNNTPFSKLTISRISSPSQSVLSSPSQSVLSSPSQSVLSSPSQSVLSSPSQYVSPLLQSPLQSVLSESLRPESLRPESLRPELLRPELLRPELLRPEYSEPSLRQPSLRQPSLRQPSNLVYNNNDERYNNNDDERYNNNDERYYNNDERYNNNDERYNNNDERYNNNDERYYNNNENKYNYMQYEDRYNKSQQYKQKSQPRYRRSINRPQSIPKNKQVQYNRVPRPDFENMSLEEKELKWTYYTLQFNTISQLHPDIKDMIIDTTDKNYDRLPLLHANYDQLLHSIYIKLEASNYAQILPVGWTLLEFGSAIISWTYDTNYFKLNNYYDIQVSSMSTYNTILYELGEESPLNIGKGMSPWAKLFLYSSLTAGAVMVMNYMMIKLNGNNEVASDLVKTGLTMFSNRIKSPTTNLNPGEIPTENKSDVNNDMMSQGLKFMQGLNNDEGLDLSKLVNMLPTGNNGVSDTGLGSLLNMFMGGGGNNNKSNKSRGNKRRGERKRQGPRR